MPTCSARQKSEGDRLIASLIGAAPLPRQQGQESLLDRSIECEARVKERVRLISAPESIVLTGLKRIVDETTMLDDDAFGGSG